MLFKRGVLKNFAILEPFFNKVAGLLKEHLGWLLLDFHGSKYLFQLNLVFTGDKFSLVFVPDSFEYTS